MERSEKDILDVNSRMKLIGRVHCYYFLKFQDVIND